MAENRKIFTTIFVVMFVFLSFLTPSRSNDVRTFDGIYDATLSCGVHIHMEIITGYIKGSYEGYLVGASRMGSFEGPIGLFNTKRGYFNFHIPLHSDFGEGGVGSFTLYGLLNNAALDGVCRDETFSFKKTTNIWNQQEIISTKKNECENAKHSTTDLAIFMQGLNKNELTKFLRSNKDCSIYVEHSISPKQNECRDVESSNEKLASFMLNLKERALAEF